MATERSCVPHDGAGVLHVLFDVDAVLVLGLRDVVHRQDRRDGDPDGVQREPAAGADAAESQASGCVRTGHRVRGAYRRPKPKVIRGSSLIPSSAFLASSSNRRGSNLYGSGYLASSWNILLRGEGALWSSQDDYASQQV